MPGPLIRNPLTNWVNGTSITQAELSALDLTLSTPINGDDGGTYTQGDGDTTIAGAGLWLAASVAHILTGSGSTLYSPDGQPITHGDSDWTVLDETHAGRARALVTSVGPAQYETGWAYDGLGALLSGAPGLEFLLPLRVHDGARLVSATLRFSVGSDHGPPGQPPKMRLVRVGIEGAAVPLTTNNVQGFASPASRPASSAAWYAAGAVQAIAVIPDDGTLIDTSRFSYFAHVVDEFGAAAAGGNRYRDVRCNFDDIVDLRPQ